MGHTWTIVCNMFAKMKKPLLGTHEEACKHMFYNSLKQRGHNLIQYAPHKEILFFTFHLLPKIFACLTKGSPVNGFKETKKNHREILLRLMKSHKLTMPACAIITSQGRNTIHSLRNEAF